MKIGNLISLFSLAAAFLAAPSGAQGSKAPIPRLSLAWLPPVQDSMVLEVRVVLPKGWYVNSNAPLDSFLVPTRLEAATAPGASGPEVVFRPPRWPEPVIEHSQAMGGNMSLFKGSFEATLTAPPLRDAKSGRLVPPPPIRVTLRYQSCDGTMCWPPKTVSAILEDGASRQE